MQVAGSWVAIQGDRASSSGRARVKTATVYRDHLSSKTPSLLIKAMEPRMRLPVSEIVGAAPGAGFDLWAPVATLPECMGPVRELAQGRDHTEGATDGNEMAERGVADGEPDVGLYHPCPSPHRVSETGSSSWRRAAWEAGLCGRWQVPGWPGQKASRRRWEQESSSPRRVCAASAVASTLAMVQQGKALSAVIGHRHIS
jgi:hypothetical protein